MPNGMNGVRQKVGGAGNMEENEQLGKWRSGEKTWEENCLEPWLRRSPERRSEFHTDIGLPVKRIYSPTDLSEVGFDYEKALGFPGQYPFTRGISPTMYRSEPWIIRAYSGFGDPELCNERYKRLIDLGVDEITMAVDLPTQVGYDSDHIMAKGEVGKVGVSINTLRDMEILFQDIPLSRLKRVAMLGNSFGPIALALFIALGEKQGLRPSEFVVDLQNDVLKEYVARGTYIFPIRPAVRVATDVVGYCARNAPHWYPMTFCANHINAAGAGSSKAAAFALANGLCYIEHLLEKGYQIDEIAPLFTAFCDERADFFVAICNARATRRVWAKIMRERFKTQNPASLGLKICAYSHGGETLLEPINNIARITLAALAYALGGVQFLSNASYDEVLGTPTEEAAKTSVRIQQILAHELGIADIVDPLGGSYFIENLTTRIENQILVELQKVEEHGGAIAAIESGYYVSQMTDGAIRRKRQFDTGERPSVGVTKFRSELKIPTGAFKIAPTVEANQVERLKEIRKERNARAVRDALEYLREVARSGENLVTPALEAVRAYSTIGEMCDVLREEFGEYQGKECFFKKG
jgi:methylmalonyl-CoA mutase, N-terminal domain